MLTKLISTKKEGRKDVTRTPSMPTSRDSSGVLSVLAAADHTTTKLCERGASLADASGGLLPLFVIEAVPEG